MTLLALNTKALKISYVEYISNKFGSNAMHSYS